MVIGSNFAPVAHHHATSVPPRLAATGRTPARKTLRHRKSVDSGGAQRGQFAQEPSRRSPHLKHDQRSDSDDGCVVTPQWVDWPIWPWS